MDLESPVNITAPNRGEVEITSLVGGGRLRVRGDSGSVLAELVAAINASVLSLGGSDFDGTLFVRDGGGTNAIQLSGRDQEIVLRNGQGEQTVTIDGQAGDVIVTGGDAAEEFDLVDGDDAPAGSVVVIAGDGRLELCSEGHDRRVAGVLSGAGGVGPGIVLGRTPGGRRRPVALAGRVFCRVDATEARIECGDLLTTSPTPGHAMRTPGGTDAFGAVLGKSMASLSGGVGLLPVLVALQ